MVSAIEYEVPEMASYKCYKLWDILYIPHYTIPGMFVSPSTKIEDGNKPYYTIRYFYEKELILLGAVSTKEQLWKTIARDQYGSV